MARSGRVPSADFAPCPTPRRRAPVYLSFADSVGASGQQAATELLIRGLSARGWVCRRLPLPAFHDSGRKRNAVRFLLWLLVAWARSVRLLWASPGRLYVNIGQTRFAFLRDAVPLLLGQAGLGRERLVISLHSSLFTRWAKDSLDSRAFGLLLRRAAGTVTVLGERQRQRLAELGIPEARIRILVNSCELEAAAPDEVVAKQGRELVALTRPDSRPFLSSPAIELPRALSRIPRGRCNGLTFWKRIGVRGGALRTDPAERKLGPL